MTSVKKPDIGREVATTRDGRDITRGYTGPLLVNTDRLLRDRGATLELYEKVASDDQVQSTFQQRRLAVVGREWTVQPGAEDAQSVAAADHLREQLTHIGWDRVTNLMLWGVYYGYAVSELVYARDGRHVAIDRIAVRHRRRFAFDDEYALRLLTPNDMTEGEPAEAPYFWHYATGSDNDDEPYGLGLGHYLYWPAYFKRSDVSYWLRFLERFAAPVGVGKYPSGASAPDRAKLLDAIAAIQHDSGIILPEGMAIDLLEASRSGTADYKALFDTMNSAISKVVLGQTMTTDDGASLSQSKTHMDVRQDIVKADADLICESFNRGPAAWITAWNYPNATPPQVWRTMEEPEDLDSRAKRDESVSKLGFKPTLAYIQETYGEGWEPAAPSTAPSPPPAFAAVADTGYLDAMVDRLSDAAGPITDEWIARLREEVTQASSFGQLLDRLGGLLPELRTDTLATILADGLGAAHRGGAADAADDADA